MDGGGFISGETRGFSPGGGDFFKKKTLYRNELHSPGKTALLSKFYRPESPY